MKRLGIVILLCLLALGGGAALYFKSRQQRESKAFEAEMPSIGVPVTHDPRAAGQPNAADIYFKLSTAQPLLQKEESARIKPALRQPWSDPDGALAALLDKNKAGMEAVREAARLPYCDFLGKEVTVRTLQTPIPQFAAVLGLARLILVDGRRAQAAGRPEEALNDYLTALAVAKHLRKAANSSTIAMLVANLILADAYEPIGSLLSDGLLPAQDYAALREGLLGQGETGALLAESFRSERGIAEEYDAFFLSHMLWFSPKSYRERLIADYRRSEQAMTQSLVSAAGKNDPQSYVNDRAGLAKRFSVATPNNAPAGQSVLIALSVCLRHPATFGDCFAANPLAPPPNYDRLIMPMFVGDAKIKVLLAAAAVRMFENQRKAPPASLSELLPEFLTGVPLDPFGGPTPLRYSADAQAWRIYSIGPDRKDDGGAVVYASEDESDWTKPAPGDIVLTCPRLVFKAAPPPPRRRARR